MDIRARMQVTAGQNLDAAKHHSKEIYDRKSWNFTLHFGEYVRKIIEPRANNAEKYYG